MKPIATLVLIADEEHAIFYQKRGAKDPLVELQSIGKSDFADIEREYQDVPVRSYSDGPGRAMGINAAEPATSERELERAAFADHVLEAAERHLQSGDYRRVALAAPPKMLGSLRAGMKGKLAAIERFEVNKNLTKEKPETLIARFSDMIAF